MPHNVLDVHDRVINQQTQRQNQSKEGYPVDRITQHQVNGQCQTEHDRYGDRDNQRFAPSQSERQQRDHNQDGNDQSLDEFVYFLVGG